MNNTFFESSRVKVFPCAYRGTYQAAVAGIFDPESRLNTEYNLTHLGNNPQYESYISKIIHETASNDYFTINFYIGGYYFEIINCQKSDFLDQNGNIYNLYIKTKTQELRASNAFDYLRTTKLLENWVDNTSLTLDRIIEGDTTSSFVGLKLATTRPAGATAELKILVNKNNTAEFNYNAFLPSIFAGYGVDSKKTVTAIQTLTNNANNDNAVAFGKYTKANGTGTFSIGNYTTAAGNYSFSAGYKTIANGEYSIAAGIGGDILLGIISAIPSNNKLEISQDKLYISAFRPGTSILIDDLTFTVKSSAFNSRKTKFTITLVEDITDEQYISFIGKSIKIKNGSGAFAESSNSFGNLTRANGKYATAFGTNTVAEENNQFVIGTFNALNENAIFIIGNGTESAPDNIWEISPSQTNVYDSTITLFKGLDKTAELSSLGELTVKDITLNNDSFSVTYTGATTIKDTVDITGITTIKNNLQIKDTAGNSTATIYSSDGSLDLNGNITIGGTETLSGTLNVNNNASIAADSGDIKTIGTITSDGLIEANGGLSVTGVVETTGNGTFKGVTSNGDIIIKNDKDITVSSIAASNGKFETTGTINSGAITSTANINATTDINLVGNINFKNDLTKDETRANINTTNDKLTISLGDKSINFENSATATNIKPSIPKQINLGSEDYKWKDLYISGALETENSITIKNTFGTDPEKIKLSEEGNIALAGTIIVGGNIKHVNSTIEGKINRAISFGLATKATADNQLAIGAYNEGISDAIVVVGNGSDTNNRKNIFEIKSASEGKTVIGTQTINNVNYEASITGSTTKAADVYIDGSITAGTINTAGGLLTTGNINLKVDSSSKPTKLILNSIKDTVSQNVVLSGNSAKAFGLSISGESDTGTAQDCEVQVAGNMAITGNIKFNNIQTVSSKKIRYIYGNNSSASENYWSEKNDDGYKNSIIATRIGNVIYISGFVDAAHTVDVYKGGDTASSKKTLHICGDDCSVLFDLGWFTQEEKTKLGKKIQIISATANTFLELNASKDAVCGTSGRNHLNGSNYVDPVIVSFPHEYHGLPQSIDISGTAADSGAYIMVSCDGAAAGKNTGAITFSAMAIVIED